jgi:hypothetical protein
MLKQMVFFSLFLISLTTLKAQNPIERKLDSFSALEVGDRVIVRLVKSDKESATIQVQGIEESAVKTVIEGNTLKISIYGEPFTKKKVLVTLKFVQLTSITVTGGADVTTTGLLKMDNLDVDLKSGGMLYLDADFKTLTGKVVEGAILTAEGYATNMNLTVNTKATLSAYELECETVTLKVGSGGKAKINVESELNADVSSQGYVSYKGKPSKITKNVSGGTLTNSTP